MLSSENGGVGSSVDRVESYRLTPLAIYAGRPIREKTFLDDFKALTLAPEY